MHESEAPQGKSASTTGSAPTTKPEVFSIDLHSKSEVWFSLNLWQTRCVQLDGREVEAKRAVSREESNKPGIHKSVKRLFMGGVKENITEPDVKAYFSS